eukprot:CAMPEP_0202913890 /NCGR_PEP_ID=MMETSP1392-20130828/61727_1 /ASSEMBLY_ACC=CAM_ASM_000868 /TAXON_ID=225041 /ORGANISM="Chlamydomonas chlamydogama, Strain SAG 11-48b" /LENGTH=63 /DNA_ID=CAMNT_0049605333 /DNA_START=89 /DNA_END=277 /DNA_ORIENTATION=+
MALKWSTWAWHAATLSCCFIRVARSASFLAAPAAAAAALATPDLPAPACPAAAIAPPAGRCLR